MGDSTSHLLHSEPPGKEDKRGKLALGNGADIEPSNEMAGLGQSASPKTGHGGAGWASLLPSKVGKESGLHPPGRCPSISNMEELPLHKGLLGMKEEASPHCLFLAS